MRNVLWKCLGFISLGMAYIGVVTPGIPFSHFLVFAAFCFAKSSPRMHAWIYAHPVFGPFLTNWNEKRIFPTRAKILMVLTMWSSLLILWFTTENASATFWSGLVMFIVAVYTCKTYPGSLEAWTANMIVKKNLDDLKASARKTGKPLKSRSPRGPVKRT